MSTTHGLRSHVYRMTNSHPIPYNCEKVPGSICNDEMDLSLLFSNLLFVLFCGPSLQVGTTLILQLAESTTISYAMRRWKESLF